MIRIAYTLCIYIVISMSVVHAQHGISAVYAPSKVIKHRDNLRFDVPTLTNEFRLAYTYQTDGKHNWQRFWKKPKIALNLIYVDFGDSETLGNAFAIVPELHFSLAKYRRLLINMQFGTGIAYLNKPYDALTNPNNNAIGSNLNNITSLKFGLEYPWNKQLTTSISTGIVHFSNGRSSSPNSGINIYGASFNVNYKFNTQQTKDLTLVNNRDTDILPSYRKWIIDAQYHYGFTEHSTIGGPKFGVHAISLGAGYRYKEYMTALIGVEYEYNDERYTFFKRNFETEENSRRMAKRSIIYIENEFRYGAVFNRFRLGLYAGWPYQKTKTSYAKVVTGIYLPTVKGYGKPYIGVVLKTHVAIADYLAIMGGISF